jgi:SAM-dependent methyltransferase
MTAHEGTPTLPSLRDSWVETGTQHSVGDTRTTQSPGVDTGRVPDPDQLLEDAEGTDFRGWDFTRLGARLVSEAPPWAFEEIVASRAARATTMLDMGTGGGEWLSALRARAPVTVATESWPPNVGVAALKLRALGVPVVQDEGATDNHRQGREDPRGRLAFTAEAFDLVTNRHESFVASEVHRVLRPAGTFVTQQAHSGSQQFHELLGVQPPRVEEFEIDLAFEQLSTAGLTVDEADEGYATTIFSDIGALAWYLRSVPWAVPGFSISAYRQALLKLHGNPIRVASKRFWLRAHK